MMKRLILILYLLILVLNINLNGAVIRNDVIYKASAYATHNWVVNTPNPRFLVYKYSGAPITGVAYSWGGKESIYTFNNSIYAGIMPRNWEGNNSGHSYTGIDCSGLVQYCWGIGIEGIVPLTDACIKINNNKIKSGDILADASVPHVVIAINNNSCYEAVGWGKSTDTLIINKDHQMVRKSATTGYSSYPPFSPFPQFDKESPADGAVIDSSMKLDSISVMIYGKGDFTTSNVSMTINGQIESNTKVKIKNDTSVLFVSYDSIFFDT